MPDAPPREALPEINSAVLQRLRKGDPKAFEMVLRACHPAVFRFAARMLGDQDAAGDIAQQTFLRLHEHRRRIEPDRGVLSWLFAVAQNLCVTHLRRRGRENAATNRLASVAPTSNLADRVVLAESVQWALATLPPDQRATVILREYWGLRHDEIARILNCSPGAARVKAHRARERLKELLADVLG